MHTPLYRRTLAVAWQFTVQHPVLWIFGICAVFLGQFGLSDFLGKVLVFSDPAASASVIAWWLGPWESAWLGSGAGWFWWLLALGAAVGVAAAVGAVTAYGALIAAASAWFKTRTRPTFRAAWQRAGQCLGRLLLLQIFSKLVMVVIFLYTLLFLFGRLEPAGAFGWLGLVLTFALLLFLVIAVSVITVYAAGYIVEGDEPLVRALALGTNLFARHLAVSVELSLLLLALNFVLFLALLGLAMAVLIPAFLTWLLAGFANSRWLWATGTVFTLAAFLVLSAAVGAIFNAFTTSAWLHLFLTLHSASPVSRLVHWLERAVKRLVQHS